MVTGKFKLEEQCESAQKNNLKSTALQDEFLLANGSLNNELTTKKHILMSHRKPQHNWETKFKLEEQYESAQKNNLKFTALQDEFLVSNGILNNKLTTTMHILMSHRKPQHNWETKKINLRKNYSKHLKTNKFVLTHNVLEIDETESKEAKSVYQWRKETWRTMQISKEKQKCLKRKMMWLHFSI